MILEIIGLIILATVFQIFKQSFLPDILGIDLLLFSTVIASSHYGFISGLFVAILPITISSLFRFRMSMIIALIILIVIALVSSLLEIPLFYLGLITAFIYSLLTFIIFRLMDKDTLIFSITYFIFNVILFRIFF